MERPAKARRSSIIREAALREGYDVSLEKSVLELAKQVPLSVVSNAARLSGSLLINRRSSAASVASSQSSEIIPIMPTPVNKLIPNFDARGSSSKVSSIPRPVSSRGRKQPLSVMSMGSSSNRSRLDAFLHSAVSNQGTRRSRSNQREDRSMYSRNSGITRTGSMESICSQTPVTTLTPSSRFLMSPGKITFTEKTDIPKTLKPPNHRDTLALGTLANIVKDFMVDHQCPQRLMLDPAKKMSLSLYLDACRFILQCLFGSNFLQNLKQENLTAKIIAISTEFKYPGALTKSVLKSPNSEHAWPAALTFLAFLCCRIETALTPITDSKDDPINEIKDPTSYSKVVLSECNRRLFCQAIGKGEIQFEDELIVYRERLREMHNKFSDSDEVILAETEETKQELANRIAEGDPRSEFIETEESQNAIIESLTKNETALTAKLGKYQDMETIEAKYSTLVRSLESAKQENGSLDQIVGAQKVDINKRKDLLKEIETLKQQREVVEQVNETTRRALKNREQFMANAQQRFYDVCCRLNVSNMFNEHLQKLELLQEVENMERMKNNPFDQDTFKAWLKSTRRVHRHTKQLMTELQQQIEAFITETETRILRCAEGEAKHADVCQDLKSQADLLKTSDDMDVPELEEEISKIKSELTDAEDVYKHMVALELEGDERLEKSKEILHLMVKEVDRISQQVYAMEEREARIFETIAKLAGPFTKALGQLIVENVLKRREIVMEDWKVDMLDKTIEA